MKREKGIGNQKCLVVKEKKGVVASWIKKGVKRFFFFFLRSERLGACFNTGGRKAVERSH